MKENEDKAYAFWQRVDELRTGTLQELADVMQMKEQSLRVMRSRLSMPRALAVKALAEHLGTTSSYLLTGEESSEEHAVNSVVPEIEFVRNNENARILIKALIQYPKLLEELSAVIAGIEERLNTQ